MKQIIQYKRNTNKELWWCNSHGRVATYIQMYSYTKLQKPCCDPKLGGIMLPCSCVNLTGQVEIEDV